MPAIQQIKLQRDPGRAVPIGFFSKGGIKTEKGDARYMVDVFLHHQFHQYHNVDDARGLK